jgi:hypothetical protein
VVRSKAHFLGVECVIDNEHTYDFSANGGDFCGALL